MIETASASPPFKSAVMPTSGNSCASSCAPMSLPNTSTVASQPSCCLLNTSKKAFHSSRDISRVGIIAPFLYTPVGNVSGGSPVSREALHGAQLFQHNALSEPPVINCLSAAAIKGTTETTFSCG